jgi:hypothetical protein
MSILYSGGLWTIFLITAVSCGYVWVLNAPRVAYKVLIILALIAIIGSQVLPESHLFRISVSEGLHWWKWALAVAIPVLGYGLLVRWIKKKADARHDP